MVVVVEVMVMVNTKVIQPKFGGDGFGGEMAEVRRERRRKYGLRMGMEKRRKRSINEWASYGVGIVRPVRPPLFFSFSLTLSLLSSVGDSVSLPSPSSFLLFLPLSLSLSLPLPLC